MLIGELAGHTGVSRRSLRYYEECGLLVSRRNDSGWREYDESAITRVNTVRDLLAIGLTVADLNRISPACLQHDLDDIPACDATVAALDRRMAELDDKIAVLCRHRDGLAARRDALATKLKEQQ